MRKTILNLTVSLDGFIEGPNGEFDWCFTDQDYGMTPFLEQTDTILLGRKSYDLLQKMGEDSFPKHQKYVFSRSLDAVNPPYHLAKGSAEQTIDALRKEEGKDMWLFGGAELVDSLLKADLIDELLLAVHPIILGSGKPLFLPRKERTTLKLLSSEQYSSGLVQLRYSFK